MPSLMAVPIAVLQELKQTERQTDKIVLYILELHFKTFSVTFYLR